MGLEKIASEADYWRDAWTETKRIIYIPWAVYWKGLKHREEQQKVAKRIGWAEKKLTVSNALIFGLGTSALYYLGGGESRDFFPNLDWVGNMKNYVVSGIANFLGITTQAFLYSWSAFNTGQSLFRIYYARKTSKAMPSISLWGALANAGHVYKILFRKEETEKAYGGS